MNQPSIRTLDCGMPLIVETIPGVRSVGLTWLIAGGSAREAENRQGLNAMWAELLYRGAGDLDSRAHADALDTLGASRSSSAGTFFLRVGATLLGNRLLDALPLFTDMVLRPRMDEASIEPVRDLCVQTLEGLKDEPQERVNVLLREKHNPSPINRSGMGTMETLAAITRDDLVNGWSAAAKPVGSVIAVAGAVDGDAVANRLNTLLGGWSGAAKPVAWSGSGVRGYHHEKEDTNQVHIALAYDAPKESDPKSMCERVANAVMSGGMSGRLFTEVREKRSLCYSVHASYRPDRDYGRVIAYSGTTPERAQETLDVLVAELRKVNGGGEATERRSDGATKGAGSRGAGGAREREAAAAPWPGAITASEFQRAVVGMKSRLVMAGESTSARASGLADDWHKLGRPRSLEEIAAKIDAVTLGEVNEHLAGRTMGTMTVATIGPEALKMPDNAGG